MKYFFIDIIEAHKRHLDNVIFTRLISKREKMNV